MFVSCVSGVYLIVGVFRFVSFAGVRGVMVLCCLRYVWCGCVLRVVVCVLSLCWFALLCVVCVLFGLRCCVCVGVAWCGVVWCCCVLFCFVLFLFCVVAVLFCFVLFCVVLFCVCGVVGVFGVSDMFCYVLL